MNHPEIPTGWFLLLEGEKIINGDMCTYSYDEGWESCIGLIGSKVGDGWCDEYICIRRVKAGPVPENIWLNTWD